MVDLERMVLLAYQGAQGPRRGSGFHLGDGLVITADHCADGTGHAVWHSGRSTPAEVAWRSVTEHVDLALLKAPGLPDAPRIPLALLDLTKAEILTGCSCSCYPPFTRAPVDDTRKLTLG